MSDLYELTRKLVARGCPEHPKLYHGLWGKWIYTHEPKRMRAIPNAVVVEYSDVRAIWTVWAMDWWRKSGHHGMILSPGDGDVCCDALDDPGNVSSWSAPTILEAIEAATRHLEPAAP